MSETEGGTGGKLSVAVYGAAGAVGGELISQLDVDPEVATVLGFDEVPAPPDLRAPKLRFKQVHGANGLEKPLADGGVTLAVYLAPLPSASSMAVDDTATLGRFLKACESAKVSGVVVTSGATIYGARRENPSFFTEGAPLKPNGLLPAEHDLARERLCAEFAHKLPESAIAVCRLALVVGPGTMGIVHRFLDTPKFLAVAGFDPPLQFVHIDDVARAIFKLLKGHKSGVYNVAPDDYTTLLQLGRTFKKPVVRASPGMAKLRMWIGSLLGGMPTWFLPLIQYPILLANKKIKRDTGFAFKYGSEEALAHHARKLARAEPQRV